MRNKVENFHDQIARLYPETIDQSIQTASLTFQVTDDCNLCCTYCYQHNKGHHVMPFAIAKQFIDLILSPTENVKKYINSYESTGVVLDFIGGEPLLQIDLIDQIATYFIQQVIKLDHPWKNHYMIDLCSNGILFPTKKVQDFFNKYKDVLSFSISIDGNKKLHDSCRIFPDGSGSYDQAIKSVNLFRENYSQELGSKMTLSPDNIYYTSEAIINLINLNYKNIFANCVFEKGWTLEHAQIYYQELKKIADYILINNIDDIYFSIFNEDFYQPKNLDDDQNWCGGNGKMIAIDYKGDIFPCLRYMESSLGSNVPPLILGNVMTDITNIKLIDTLQSITRLSQSSINCIQCSIAAGCSWCQAYNYEDSGNLNHRATYICIMHKAASLANVYFWNSYYKKNNIKKIFNLYLSESEILNIISLTEYMMLKELLNHDSNY